MESYQDIWDDHKKTMKAIAKKHKKQMTIFWIVSLSIFLPLVYELVLSFIELYNIRHK